MCKITKEAVDAFLNGINFSKDNTRVIHTHKYSFLYLHGNCIARQDSFDLMINHQGYLTNITKERLNGIPGVHIQQKKGIWYLNDELIKNGWNII